MKFIYKSVRLKVGVRAYAGFARGSMVKNPPANAGDTSLISGLGSSPGGGNGNPLQYSCLENSHGQRSLAGYSPWTCKELDTTEQLSVCVCVCVCVCVVCVHAHRPLAGGEGSIGKRAHHRIAFIPQTIANRKLRGTK